MHLLIDLFRGSGPPRRYRVDVTDRNSGNGDDWSLSMTEADTGRTITSAHRSAIMRRCTRRLLRLVPERCVELELDDQVVRVSLEQGRICMQPPQPAPAQQRALRLLTYRAVELEARKHRGAA